jgi:hypothetical protein
MSVYVSISTPPAEQRASPGGSARVVVIGDAAIFARALLFAGEDFSLPGEEEVVFAGFVPVVFFALSTLQDANATHRRSVTQDVTE